jgi:hypothetical protein
LRDGCGHIYLIATPQQISTKVCMPQFSSFSSYNLPT